MNKWQFNLLTKLKNKKGIVFDSTLTDRVYDFYETKMLLAKKDINISKEEINLLLFTTYSILGLNITNDDFESVTWEYINQIVCDEYEKNEVNIKWCINHLWYYRLGDREIVEKFTNDIDFAQEMLIKNFSVDENIKEKAKRKIVTATLIK